MTGTRLKFFCTYARWLSKLPFYGLAGPMQQPRNVIIFGLWKSHLTAPGSGVRFFKLRHMACQSLDFKLGNGCSTLLWFDPWWKRCCLASKNSDLIIYQSGLLLDAKVNVLLSSGSWIMPTTNPRHHHVQQSLLTWINEFDYPAFDMNRDDSILRMGIPLAKLKIWHI